MMYLLNHFNLVAQLLGQHLRMTSLSLLISVMIAVPIAVLLRQLRWLNLPILSTLNILYTIPSLALIIFLVPILGLNEKSVIAAIVLYCQTILVRSIDAGFRSIPPELLEAGKGMGMNSWQQWWQVQLPLMLPIFLAGVRLSTIAAVAIATIGAKFGAGGLGTLLFDGIAQAGRYDKITAGAIATATLTFSLNTLLFALESALTPPASLNTPAS